MCDSVMTRDVTKSQELKGGTADEAFQEPCFLWESGAFLGLFVFQIVQLAQEHS